MKKLGLALGAGGTRGVAHAGVLQAFEENNIKIDYLAGSSMGSLVGSQYALGKKPIELKEILLSIKQSDFFDLSLFPLKSLGIIRGVKVEKVLEGYFEGKRFEDCKIPFKCTALDLISGKDIIFDKGEMIKCVLASCSIPTMFKPVEMDGMILVDGGVINRVPVDIVKDMGADVVIGIDVLEQVEKIESIDNIFHLILRTFNILDSTITQFKLEKSPVDLILRPVMKDVSPYKVKNAEHAYESGYKIAMENIEKIKRMLD